MKYYIRKENGKNLLDFEEYKTNELVVTKKEKIGNKKSFMYIEPCIEYRNDKGKLILY